MVGRVGMTGMNKNQPRIAVIGAGIAGLSAAYFLRNNAQITLYEQENRLGGHSRTIHIQTAYGVIPVDTGFIVFNTRTYPNLLRLFHELAVEIQPSNMSFAASTNSGQMEWAGRSINSWFAQRQNILNIPMWRGLVDLIRFNQTAVTITHDKPEMTVRELLIKLNCGNWFRHHYLLPMVAAIWSCPIDHVLDFPAHFLVQFMYNHGLLQIYRQPQWLTLKNRSADYVERLVKIAKPTIILSAEITAIKRQADSVIIMAANGQNQLVDQVIFACHPQIVLSLLKDATNKERYVLSKFQRHKNIAYTHRDPNWMPQRIKCWSSWNYLSTQQNGQTKIAVTYWMNKLQSLPDTKPVFVTLNPWQSIANKDILDQTEFYHPTYDLETYSAQKDIAAIQGENRCWFTGAYLGYGFHEDGIKSSLQVIQKMGLSWS